MRSNIKGEGKKAMVDRRARGWIGAALASAALVAGMVTLSVSLVAADADSTETARAEAFSEPATITSRTPPGRTLGFVATYFYYAMHQGDDACPKGTQPIQTSADFLKKFPEKERARLLKPENQRELYTKMAERGPNGENVCKFPLSAPDPQMYTLAGDRNDGLDLDGSADDDHAGDYTCAHKQFVGDDGRPGVDNQVGRMYACLAGVREKGTLTPYFTQVMRDGMWSMLIEVSEVDDVRNDNAVTVDLYAGEDTMVKDGSGNVLTGASLAPKPDPKFHRRVQGRIVEGVLETPPIKDMLIPDIMLTSRMPPMLFERPRLKLTLLENGNAKGYLGGYMPVTQYIGRQDEASGEAYTGVLCNGIHYAAMKFADGGRDPKTGKCSTMSTAFRIEAIPAFIVHPDRAPIRTFAEAK